MLAIFNTSFIRTETNWKFFSFLVLVPHKRTEKNAVIQRLIESVPIYLAEMPHEKNGCEFKFRLLPSLDAVHNLLVRRDQTAYGTRRRRRCLMQDTRDGITP